MESNGADDRLWFEDIAVGDRFTGATATADREQMLEFAREFDDQPMHVDPEAARAMGFSDIIASGAYIFPLCNKSMRTIWNSVQFLPSGNDIEVSFLRPLYPGDTHTAHVEVVGTRRSSKPGQGWVKTRVEFLNRAGDTTARISSSWRVRTREN